MAIKLIYGVDVLDGLAQLPSESVHCVVTSPPYWALRSYLKDGDKSKHLELGSEKTPDEFVANMVKVFQGVRRVLRSDGVCWINLGDTYGNGGGGGCSAKTTLNGASEHSKKRTMEKERIERGPSESTSGLASGNLVGIPWRVALALQADGWVLRQDIIWHKKAPMPESVKNRCTKSHEYIFMMTKGMGYYYDADAICEPATPAERTTTEKSSSYDQAIANGKNPSGNGKLGATMKTGDTRNKRSVWSLSPSPYPEAHFATYPEELPETCIKASTSKHGCCGLCGTPYVVNHAMDKTSLFPQWERTCSHVYAKTLPCIVLDPFSGSGTTCQVAAESGMQGIGIDLSKDYHALAVKRIGERHMGEIEYWETIADEIALAKRRSKR